MADVTQIVRDMFNEVSQAWSDHAVSGSGYNCTEAEAIVEAMDAVGYPSEQFRCQHAESDNEPSDAHHLGWRRPADKLWPEWLVSTVSDRVVKTLNDSGLQLGKWYVTNDVDLATLDAVPIPADEVTVGDVVVRIGESDDGPMSRFVLVTENAQLAVLRATAVRGRMILVLRLVEA